MSDFRYKAFISYSHGDETWARWLHRTLESYRTPRRLVGRVTASGVIPARLSPVFRDREELASSSDLSERIDTALRSSENLIVICSPRAANSRWVDQEIEIFKKLGRDARIFCLIVYGDPSAAGTDRDCFPPAVRRRFDRRGNATPHAVEPLAADLRDTGDGRALARLKLLAGLLGVELDELRQREVQRRQRKLLAVTVVSLVAVAITTGLAVNALLAKRESELRRAQGEELIDFMLVQLRSQLEPIGKLDILDSVGEEALKYFNALGSLGTPDERLSRALALRQIGEIRFDQGDLEMAEHAFAESIAIISALSEETPSSDEHRFQLGQSQFWVGYVAWQRSDLERSRHHFEKYQAITAGLLAEHPADPVYLLEMSYAQGNLGSLAVEEGRSEEAITLFRQAADYAEQVTRLSPDNAEAWRVLQNAQSWMGTAQLKRGELENAAASLGAAVASAGRSREIESSPANRHLLAAEQLNLGMALLHRGRVSDALDTLFEAARSLTYLVEHDPSNASWYRDLGRTRFRIAEVLTSQGELQRAGDMLAQALAIHASLWDKEPGSVIYVRDLSAAESLEALHRYHAGNLAEARLIAARAFNRMSSMAPSASMRSISVDAAQVAHIYGVILSAQGEREPAQEVFSWGLDQLPSTGDSGILELAARHKLVVELAGPEAGHGLSSRLRNAGFSDPRFPAL